MSIYIREKQLSPESLKVLSEVSNKSLFVREAIEFYVHHGKEILKELKNIKELINSVPNLSTQYNSNKNKEVTKPIEPKSEVQQTKINNRVENSKDDITDEKKKEIEQQLLRTINMFS